MATTTTADSKTVDFILPDLGEGVHEAELISWKVSVGQTINEMDVLAEMETDKALVEVPSPFAGTIVALHGKEGEIVHVGNPIVSFENATQSGEAVAAGAPSKESMIESGDSAALAAEPKTMGADNRHLALQLEQHRVRIRAVGFGKSDWIESLTNGTEYFDFAFKPVINEFRGRRNVELHLIDYRQSQPASMSTT